ncbi:MAG: hypothetical protein IT310_03480 [Anaerolineales bacterium]|nr:hypothetical protein [Anaerolineales bacterium]
MKAKLNLFILPLLILMACSPAPAPKPENVETIVAGTLQAFTAAAPVATEVNGVPFTDDNLSFVIPTGIAASAAEEVVPAVQASADAPWWEVAPEHHIYRLENYVISDGYPNMEIYLYPLAEYAAMNADVAKRVEALKSLIASPNQPLPESLPFLPAFNAGQMFHSNFEALQFQNGSGIRYLTSFSQFPGLISNNILLYTFQGITADGAQYVSATLPINIGFLSGYPTPTNPTDFVAIEIQVKTVAQQLDESSPEAFNPSISTLDALIQSIQVSGTP